MKNGWLKLHVQYMLGIFRFLCTMRCPPGNTWTERSYVRRPLAPWRVASNGKREPTSSFAATTCRLVEINSAEQQDTLIPP